ncbi:MAG: TGS domain-containing protein [Candidatus Aenigmarchaeota archaeon]|nr:TGS domain-containing protein [Candidatus Aenigmarchaeota archaeon]
MPANLPPEWYAKKEESESATGKEKIKKIQELLSLTPTHKGCERIRSQLKKKIAELKKESKKKASLSRKSLSIPKEGCARVSIIGIPNSGKSTFLKKITSADPKIDNYPYTTTKPEVGMLDFGGAQIQMIEIPSTHTKEVLSIAKSSEIILFLIGENMSKAYQRKELEKLAKKENLKNYIFIQSNISKKDLFKKIWPRLGLIRVHTKESGKKKTDKPVILNERSTVEDVCKRLHKDFFRYFKFAKISGPSAKFNWERVGLEHKLKDGDIVEIHMKK